jgi:hypothetical protein
MEPNPIMEYKSSFFYKNEDFVVGEKYNTLLVQRIVNSPKWPNEVYEAIKGTEYYAGSFLRFQMHETGRHDDRTCSYFFKKDDGSEHVVWLDYLGRTRFRRVFDCKDANNENQNQA